MPGVIRAAVSVGTLPYSLSIKFSESRAVQMNMNEYHDGSCQRVSLVTGSRRTWKLSKRLDAFHLGLLRAFCNTVQGGAFQFYNPFETLPAFTKNPIGTSGLYLVRFNSDWSQINGMGRSDCDLEIIEVSATGAIDIGAPIVPGVGGTGGGVTPPPPGFAIVAINSSVSAGEWLYANFQGFIGYGPIVYGGALWVYGAASEYESVVSDGVRTSTSGAGMYRSVDGGQTWVKQGGAQTFLLPFAAYWDPGAAKVTFLLDGYRGGTAELVEFDMATASYGSVSIPSPPLDSPSSDPFRLTLGEWLHKLSDGTYRILYDILPLRSPDFAPTSGELYYLDYAGGSWTAPTLLAGSIGNFYRPVFTVQDGNTIHIFSGFATSPGVWNKYSPAQEYKYWRLNPDGTTSTTVALDSALTVQDNIQWNVQAGIISGDSILSPAWKRYSDSSATTAIGVLVGTPKDNPTFTWVQLAEDPTNDGAIDMKLIRLGSIDYAAWALVNPVTFNNGLIYLAKSTDHGATWTAPQLLLSLDATPPPLDGTHDAPRDIMNFSLGTQLDETKLGLMFTTTLQTYWTNAPALLT